MPPIDPVRGLTELLDRLNGSGVPYMLVGAAAGYWYGLDRTTNDFDFVADFVVDKIPAFVRAFTPGFYCDDEMIDDAVRTKFMFNVISHSTGFKADIMILKDDAFQHSAFSVRAAPA